MQADIELIRAKVATMASLTDQTLKISLPALTEQNRQSAYSIILRDRYIDELETELDRLCLDFLVRHQPVAGRLRMVFATILIDRDLERIGDYAESIARQVLALSEQPAQYPAAEPVELRELGTQRGYSQSPRTVNNSPLPVAVVSGTFYGKHDRSWSQCLGAGTAVSYSVAGC